MADPANNYVPTTANFKIMSDVADDPTIQSAVEYTVGGGPYTTFDALRAAANTALIDDTYGTVGLTPTTSGEFRGYPKATVDMNYEMVPMGTSPTWQKLVCIPTLNVAVGFPITITVEVIEEQGFPSQFPPEPVQHDETFTFNAGSTVPDSSSLSPESGKYRLDRIYPMPTYTECLYIIADYATANNHFTYVLPTDHYIKFLVYDGDCSP